MTHKLRQHTRAEQAHTAHMAHDHDSLHPDQDHEHRHCHGSSHGDHAHDGLWGRAAHLLSEVFGWHSHDSAESTDTALEADDRGRRALWISFFILAATTALQAVIVFATNSVALLGDTLHNLVDAFTTVPLLVAFALLRKPANDRFTYGYGRAEDVAGLFVVLAVASSAVIAAWEAVQRLIHPAHVDHLLVLALGGVVGFLGNEWVARYRIRVGHRIGSAALVTDGLHARTDGFASLAVVLSAAGLGLGWRWADPVILGAFVEQVSDDRFFALWMLIATTGAQLEALTALERHDFDVQERRIAPASTTFRRGGRSLTAHRSFALDPTTYNALKDHVIAWDKERYVLGQDTQKLFVWSNGEQVDRRAIHSMFGQHCATAGVPVVPRQQARQAYVTAAIETGIPVKVISERLGHSVEPRDLRALPRLDGAPLADGTRRSRGGSRSCRSRSF